MIKKVIFGFIWFVTLYLGTCILAGAIAGGIAGVSDPQHASEAGRVAGRNTVIHLRPYIFLASLALASIGSWKGFLPGTKSRKKSDEAREG